MPTLQIQLFGAFQVLVDGQPWNDFRSDKTRALLAYLAVEGATPRGRNQLTTLLWAGYKRDAARASLRVTLSNLRHLPMPAGLLRASRQAVQWCARPPYCCDVLLLDELLQRSPAPLDDAQRQGVEQLYQGDFLPGFEQIDSLPFQTWVHEKRAYYAQRVSLLRRRSEVESPALLDMDWGAIPYAAHFRGRQQERDTLTHWLVAERSRLVALWGLAGQGKTALAAQVARDLTYPPPTLATELPASPRFTRVIWRSLTHAPPLSEILLSWLQVLSDQQVTHLPTLLEDQLALLMRYLRAQPCLLVLDNLESVLADNNCPGCYQPGCQAYGELLRRVAASEHQSCLLIISREQPQDFHRLQTTETAVRALSLPGLTVTDAQQVLQTHGLCAPEALYSGLAQRYSGHPLALHLAAETIVALFGGNIANFLDQAPLIFGTLRTLLDQQFARISPLEQQILIDLACDDNVYSGQTQRSRPPLPTTWAHLDAERSLLRRLLIEARGDRLALPTIMLEYIVDYLSKPAIHDATAMYQAEGRSAERGVWSTAPGEEYRRWNDQARGAPRPLLPAIIQHKPAALLT